MKKIVFVVLWFALLLLGKFFLFNLDYDRYYKIVSISTYLLYFSILVLITAFLIKKKLLVVSNLFMLLSFLVLLEFASYLLVGLPKRQWIDYSNIDMPPEHKASYLGNISWADSVFHDVKISATGDTFVDVHYSIDAINRRITPDCDSTKDQYALFFGCSVCFGFGLEDDQTIPFLIQEKSEGYNAYNYAYNGWGPHHMLSLLEHENLEDQIPEKNGEAVYIFLWSHIRRAIGDYQVYTGWGHTMPYYALEDGEAVYKGNFNDRKVLSKVYQNIQKLYAIQLFGLNFPLNTNESHYALVAEIMNKSKRMYSEQFGNENFTVLIYPDIWDELDDERMQLFLHQLEIRGINYLDYTDYEYLIRDEYILEDGHPNFMSNDELTDKLVIDLELN